jgi:hypothetical protein
MIGKCQGESPFSIGFYLSWMSLQVGFLKVLNKKEVGMTTITLEEARLIIKLWAESSALLLVGTSEQPGDVLGRFSVVETTDGGVLLRSVGGDTQFSLDLSHYETTCSYSEPREYSETEEYKGWISTVSDSEKLTSCLGFSFCVRFTGPPPLEDLLVPVGKVVLIELAR